MRVIRKPETNPLIIAGRRLKRPNSNWEDQEAYVAELLDLARTTSSGNKFHDPGDAVSRLHYSQQRYRLYAECKSTVSKTYSLRRTDLAGYSNRAREYGKLFTMPIRFVGEEDYILLRLLDFSDILSDAQSERPTESVDYLRWIIGKIASPSIRAEAESHLRKILGEQ